MSGGSGDGEEDEIVETNTATKAGAEVRLVDARELLGARGLLRIEHRGEVYTLRITRNDRLILTADALAAASCHDRLGRSDDRLARFALASALLHALAAWWWLDHGLGHAPAPPAPSAVQVRIVAAPAPQPVPAAEPTPVEPPPAEPVTPKPPDPVKPKPITPKAPEPVAVEPPRPRSELALEPPAPTEPVVEPAEPVPVEPPPQQVAVEPTPPEPAIEPPPEPVEVPPAPAELPRAVAAAPPAVAAAPPVAATVAPAPGFDEPDPFEAYVALVRARIEAERHYPAMARRRRIEGSVQVRLSVGSAGDLGEVRTVGDAPRMLVEPTLDAVRRAAPFPAPPEGLGWIEVPVRYRMDD